MSVAHCAICLNYYPLEPEKFGIFPCGHGFCTECIVRLCSNSRPKCPNCRAPLDNRDVHAIHVDLIDPHSFFQMNVVDGLSKMGADTPSISVKKARLKLGKVVHDSRAESADLGPLVQALDDFKERIEPVFSRVDTLKEEIEELQDESRKLRRDKAHLQNKLKKAEPLQVEVTQLRTTLSEMKQQTNEALCLAEIAKTEVANHLSASTQWKKMATELELENKRYKDMLDRHANNARLQKEKNRKLSKQVTSLTEQLAVREKAALSIAPPEYNFSVHEDSRGQPDRSRPSPSKLPRRSTHSNENKPELELDGIPSANFPSEWQIEGVNVLRKRDVNGTLVSRQRRVANSFPINLDKKGNPTKAVSLGPKSVVRIGR